MIFVIYVIGKNGFQDVLSKGITMEKPLKMCMPFSLKDGLFGKEREVIMKVFRRIGVSILVVFLTIGLCYCEAWGSVDKERAIAHYTTGCSYLEKGQWDKAIAEYNEAIKLYPRYVEAYFYRGYAYDENCIIET